MYKELKKISAAGIYRAGNKDCEEFADEFDTFITLFANDFLFSKSIPLDDIKGYFKDHPSWEDFLMEHQFISKEEIIKQGDLFRWRKFKDNLYMLIEKSGLYNLLCIESTYEKNYGTYAIKYWVNQRRVKEVIKGSFKKEK